MKKLLSFALLAGFLSIAQVAQSAPLYNWSYTFSHSMEWTDGLDYTTDLNGTESTYSAPFTDTVIPMESPFSDNWSYSSLDFGTVFSPQVPNSDRFGTLTTSIFFDNNEGISFTLSLIANISVEGGGLYTFTPVGDEPSETFLSNGYGYQIGFYSIYPGSSFEEIVSPVAANSYSYQALENNFMVGHSVYFETWKEEPAPTPEPATMLLMGAGLAGLGALKRRRNKKA